MDFFSNFSTYASMARKALTIAATFAVSFGIVNSDVAGAIFQGYDALTTGIVSGLGGLGLIVSVWASAFAKNKPATVAEVKTVAANAVVPMTAKPIGGSNR